MEPMRHIPRLIVLELTRRCTLSCIHCRAAAKPEVCDGELGTEEWLKLLRDISSFSRPIIILSGGEALLRDDVFDIIRSGSRMGLRVVLATCGIPLTEEIAGELKRSGIKRISISMDGKDAATHDGIRGVKGVFEKAISAMQILKSQGTEFQVNTTVTRRNLDQLENILGLAVEYGAVGFHPFFLVPVGRAKDLRDEEISPSQYEAALNWLYQASKDSSISLRPTCAPHYFRIMAEDNAKGGGTGMNAMTGGCLGGKSFAFVSSTGKVQICGFLEVECGDVRKDSFPEIWRDSPVFENVRDLGRYRGKCGACKYLRICGGCRARAYETTGDYLEEEPDCVYQPLTA